MRDSLKLNALVKHKAAGLIVLPDKHAIDNWESTVIQNYMENYIYYAEIDINKKVSPESVIPLILLKAETAQLLLTGLGDQWCRDCDQNKSIDIPGGEFTKKKMSKYSTR